MSEPENNLKNIIIIADTYISSAMMFKYKLKPYVYFDAEAKDVIVGFINDQATARAILEYETTGTISVKSINFAKYYEQCLGELGSVHSYVQHIIRTVAM